MVGLMAALMVAQRALSVCSLVVLMVELMAVYLVAP